MTLNDEAPDEIRILKEGWRLLGNDVQAELVARGWAVAALDVADDEPLEFFWPPTAPVHYGGLPEWRDRPAEHRPDLHPPRRTPWTAPTRITRTDTGWLLVYGQAIAQDPDEPVEYTSDEVLMADLERIEWWPMSVDEAHQIQRERLYVVTAAAANDDHYQGFTITEPYGSRITELMEHVRFDAVQQNGLGAADEPSTSRPRGNLDARMKLIDAAAWASAVRTSRVAGGL